KAACEVLPPDPRWHSSRIHFLIPPPVPLCGMAATAVGLGCALYGEYCAFSRDPSVVLKTKLFTLLPRKLAVYTNRFVEGSTPMATGSSPVANEPSRVRIPLLMEYAETVESSE